MRLSFVIAAVGLALVVAGVALLSIPLALICAGLSVTGFGLLREAPSETD